MKKWRVLEPPVWLSKAVSTGAERGSNKQRSCVLLPVGVEVSDGAELLPRVARWRRDARKKCEAELASIYYV